MKHKLFFLITFFVYTTIVYAENAPEPAEQRTGSFYFMVGGGSYKTEIDPDPASAILPLVFGPSANNRLLYDLAVLESFLPATTDSTEGIIRAGYDFRFGDSPFIRGNAGLSHAQGTETCIENCGTYLNLFILDQIQNPPAGGGFPFYYFLLFGGDFSSLFSTPEVSFNYTTIDFGVSGYFNPDQMINPYIGFEFGLGFCSVEGVSGAMCTVLKGGIKAGLEVNLTERTYLMLQAEHYAYRFTFTVSSTNEEGGSESVSVSTPTFRPTNVLLGFGYRI